MEIYHISKNNEHFQLIKRVDYFFIRVLLEKGFMQIEKIIQIDDYLFSQILNDTRDFDPYIFQTQQNSDLLMVKTILGKNCTVYKLNDNYFLEEWEKQDIPLKGQKIAKEISKEKYETLLND